MIIGTIMISLITYKTYRQSVREMVEAATFVALPIYSVSTWKRAEAAACVNPSSACPKGLVSAGKA